jgi:hypothetical protein
LNTAEFRVAEHISVDSSDALQNDWIDIEVGPDWRALIREGSRQDNSIRKE